MEALFIDLCFKGGYRGEVAANEERCFVDCDYDTAAGALDKILGDDKEQNFDPDKLFLAVMAKKTL